MAYTDEQVQELKNLPSLLLSIDTNNIEIALEVLTNYPLIYKEIMAIFANLTVEDGPESKLKALLKAKAFIMAITAIHQRLELIDFTISLILGLALYQSRKKIVNGEDSVHIGAKSTLKKCDCSNPDSGFYCNTIFHC